MTTHTEKDFLEVALLVFALFTMAAVCFGVVKAVIFLDRMEPKLIVTTENIDRTVYITGSAMGNFEKASRSLTAREDAEQKLINSTVAQLGTVTTEVGGSLAHLNTAIDSIGGLVENSNRNMNTLAADSDTAIRDLHPALVSLNSAVLSTKTTVDSLNLTVIAANKLVSDPTIPKTLINIQDSTANLASSTKQIDTSLKVDVLPYVHRLTKPAKAGWVILKEAAHDVSAGIGGFFGTHGF